MMSMRLRRAAAALLLGPCALVAQAQFATPLSLDDLPRPSTPPAERGPVLPAQVEGWRREAEALEHGDAGMVRDPVQAAQLYCRAARHGDAVAQYNLAWMLVNARGIARDDAQAAHLFAAAAEQGLAQARNMAERLGEPRGAVPDCLRPPPADPLLNAQAARPHGGRALPPPLPRNAPEVIVKFVRLEAPLYKLEPHLVLAVMAQESNFDPLAQSPRNAQGLMQLIPATAQRFKVGKITDPVQNIRGGMAYLRWLLAYFQGDLPLVLAAYNAGEGAVDRYRGVPPYAETRNYVQGILAAINDQRSHPFDASITPPSSALEAWRKPLAGRTERGAP